MLFGVAFVFCNTFCNHDSFYHDIGNLVRCGVIYNDTGLVLDNPARNVCLFDLVNKMRRKEDAF